MNREIKFRGKDRESWHYGDLVREIRHNDNKLFDGTFTHIRNFEYKNGDYIGESFPVNPDTIGQYIGLHDKNGKEIYEGDIVKDLEYKIIGKIEYIEYMTGYFLVYGKSKCISSICEVEVIGNVWEDSELLGGE